MKFQCKASKMLPFVVSIFYTLLFGSINGTDQLMQRKNPTWLKANIERMNDTDQLMQRENSTWLKANIERMNDTDQLMQRENSTWLKANIERMSAKYQLDSINIFKENVDNYREQTNYVLPLGPKSKGKLRNMSSWLYSNLVADSFNQNDLPDIIQCAISLSKCFFSNHYLFDALEYQLWSYNHELPGLGDLGYTKLFFAMAQSQYFPKQQTFVAWIPINSICPEQQNSEETSSSAIGFEFHTHLGKIVNDNRRKIQNTRLDFYKKKEIAEILTNIIIGYNMMSCKAFSSIEKQFESMEFPLNRAITTLADLLDTCADDNQGIVKSIPNKKNLYRSLLLDFISKTETETDFSASTCFNTSKVLSGVLEKQRKLILDMRAVINSHTAKSSGSVSRFETLVGDELSKLDPYYTVKTNVYDLDLCSEIDFVITNTQTGMVIRIETDGYFHFNQNFHNNGITSDLNGETRLKTNLLKKFGKVLRVSGACNRETYRNRISSVLKATKNLEASDFQVGFNPSPAIKLSEYASCI